jgi:hypothetical protein
VTRATENTYLRCDTAVCTRSGHFQHHHHSFSARLFRATLALIRATTLSYKGVTFVGWHMDVTFLSHTLFVLMVYVLLYIISLRCVVCWHIVLMLIEYWYGIMNRLWTGWTRVWILVGARFFSSSKHSDQLWDDTTSYSMCTSFFPGKKAASLWSISLTSIYCWGYKWLELYLYFPCMCEFLLRYFKTMKTTVYVQMPQQLMVFMISSFCHVLYVVCFLLGNSPASGVYMPLFRNTLSVTSTCLWRWNRQSVPKCRHINSRCRGIT